MGILFALASVVALIALGLGLIKPANVKCATRGKVVLWYGSTFVVLLVIGIAITPASDTSIAVVTTPTTLEAPVASATATRPTPTPVSDNTASQAKAQTELDEVIKLAKAANLVTSYEFSDRATVVYAGPVWYTQSVAFKKDFMAKIATLKKVITGYAHFEVRDVNSNEKVGEVTAFSQSLQVYK